MESNDDHMDNIENAAAMMSMGRMGLYVYRGAVYEGARPKEATDILIAFFAGMIRGTLSDDDDDNS